MDGSGYIDGYVWALLSYENRSLIRRIRDEKRLEDMRRFLVADEKGRELVDAYRYELAWQAGALAACDDE